MPLGNQKMGFEGILYYGVAGSTATTQLENTRDINLNMEVERGDTTVRGDSLTPPIKTSHPTARMVGIEFQIINDITDAALAAMLTAAANGDAVALRGKDYAAGKGPDADFTLSVSKPMPLAGEQVITIQAEPTRANGRTPQAYV